MKRTDYAANPNLTRAELFAILSAIGAPAVRRPLMQQCRHYRSLRSGLAKLAAAYTEKPTRPRRKRGEWTTADLENRGVRVPRGGDRDPADGGGGLR